MVNIQKLYHNLVNTLNIQSKYCTWKAVGVYNMAHINTINAEHKLISQQKLLKGKKAWDVVH